MGTKFFQGKSTTMNPSNLNMQARAISSGNYGGRVSAGNASKDIGAAMALYKAHALKPLQRSAAYPPGPKKV